jgi:uncharacterized membrane protein YraQ (UPF0718 family)
MPARFARSLGVLSVRIVPEYFIVVFLLGVFGGVLFPFDGGQLGIWALIAAAALATLLVIPTGGEIPIALGLAAAGASQGVVGALLIGLPALSLPSMVMLAGPLGRRPIALAGAGVFAASVLAGLLLWALTP